MCTQAYSKMLWTYLIGIALHCGIKDSCFATSHAIATTIFEDLFSDHYNKKLIPICEDGGRVTLQLQTALRQIMDLNEKDQALTVNIWLRMKWNDCRLKWNMTSYGNVTYFNVPYDTVWVPDITVYDSAAEEEMMPGRPDYYATVYNDGTVTYNFPTVIKSVCRVDVTYFPFDTQSCGIQFGSWSHHGFDLDVISSKDEADLSMYVEHNEWNLRGMPVVRRVLHYQCCVEPYPDLTFYIKMERKSRFYVMTVLFPCILTSVVATLSFLLPVESGEKVSLGVTVLLSLAVFLLLVSESMPASSDSFPYIGMYFASSMVLVSLSCFMTVIVLNFHFRGCSGKKVPKTVKKILIDGLGRFLCSHKGKYSVAPEPESNIEMEKTVKENGSVPKEDTVDSPSSGTYVTNVSTKELYLRTKDPLVTLMREQKTALDNLVNHVHKDDSTNDEWNDWHMLSRVLDRLFFMIYVVSSIITSAIFLGILGKGESS